MNCNKDTVGSAKFLKFVVEDHSPRTHSTLASGSDPKILTARESNSYDILYAAKVTVEINTAPAAKDNTVEDKTVEDQRSSAAKETGIDDKTHANKKTDDDQIVSVSREIGQNDNQTDNAIRHIDKDVKETSGDGIMNTAKEQADNITVNSEKWSPYHVPGEKDWQLNNTRMKYDEHRVMDGDQRIHSAEKEKDDHAATAHCQVVCDNKAPVDKKTSNLAVLTSKETLDKTKGTEGTLTPANTRQKV